RRPLGPGRLRRRQGRAAEHVPVLRRRRGRRCGRRRPLLRRRAPCRPRGAGRARARRGRRHGGRLAPLLRYISRGSRATEQPVATTPQLQGFIDYYAGPRGRAPKLSRTGFEVVPLPPEILAWLTARLAATWGAPGHPHFEIEFPDRTESARNGLVDDR